MTLIADILPEILARKDMVRKMSEKAVFQRTLRQRTQEMSRNTVAILMTALFQYLLITLQVVALEEVSFSDRQTPKTVS